MLKRPAQFTSVMLCALSTGVFFGTKVSLGPSNKDFTPGTYVEVQQASIRNVGPVMTALLPGAVAANAALLLVLSRSERRSPAFGLTLGALCAQLASVVLTRAIEVPINDQVMSWSPEHLPQGWQASRDRWDTIHTLRTASSVVGLACLVGATLA